MNATQKPTLLLIDGHSLAFRAFYALSPDSFKTSDGQHTNAVHGFISMMLEILKNERPTHLAVAFDLSRSSFRTEEYAEYKGTRGETPPEFIGQTELLTEALAAMNITTITRTNFEADDIIASLADQAADQGFTVYVVSGDRDTFQLIRPETTILYPVKGVLNMARMTDEAVYEKYGVHAKQYPDLAALVGETSDNLPGIPGVGPKTAAKWLQAYGSLDGVFAAADEITGKVGESLREHRELAVRNRRLNHLVRDLPFDFELDEGLLLGPVDEAKVRQVFGKLQFKTLTERVLRQRGTNGTQTATAASLDAAAEDRAPEAEAPVAPAVDLPPSRRASLDEAAAWLAEHRNLVGVSLEFAGPDPEHASLIGLGLASETERLSVVVPNLEAALASIGGWLKDAAAPKAMFDTKNNLRRLIGATGNAWVNDVANGFDYDPLLLTYLLNPVRRGYGLDDIAGEYLGLSVERGDPSALIDDNETDPSLDAWLSLTLATELHQQVDAQQQLRVYSQVELPSSAVLAQMEHHGVRVNRAKLEAQFEALGAEVNQIAQEAYAIIGEEVNLASPKQLQTILFDKLGMTGTKTVKTGFSTNAAALNELYEQTQHPFLEKLLAHRESSKIRQMVEIVLKAIGTDGRVHTSYGQTGTSTGRLSSDSPNLQNIPIKTERGRQIRAAFEVGEGFETLLTADYSQIEMRIMAHLSEDEGLIEAFKTGEDLHRFVGSRIFGVAPSEVTTPMRSKVKAMSYGLVYGLSEYGLAKQLRISNAEAKQLMADYFARFGGVKRYLARVVDIAKTEGFTTTTFGRRRPFDDLNSKIFQLRENARRAALNAPIQGTAADIMKLAMNQISEQIQAQGLKSRMLLQVHDELVFEVAAGELDTLRALVEERMANVVELSVPLEVHVGVGVNWDEAGH
ncbi:MAG: DNA polymerase I [Micrococcales bacterium]